MLHLFKVNDIYVFYWVFMINLLNSPEFCFKNIFLLDFYNIDNLTFNQVFLVTDYIKMQELSFLPEYFLITSLFCLTLFFLFSVQFIPSFSKVSIKFQYHHQFIFLLIFILSCYLIVITQQWSVSSLILTSFNNTINNDLLALFSKCVIGLTSLLYLTFINGYLKEQKLSNFEYFIVLFISIFGFLLLCCVNDFITAYLAIELQGLAFYLLASFKKSSNFSVESGVKYFVLGSLSTALFLLGITIIYGLCGSIVFSDFKDFFIWTFVANSLVFIFDSFFSGLDFLQEKLGLDSNLEQYKLKNMYDKLALIQKNIKFFNIELARLKLEFENVSLDFSLLEKMELVNQFVKNFLAYYYEISYNSILNFFSSSKIIDSNFLQATCLVSSMNDFLLESIYYNNLLGLIYLLQDSLLNYQNFMQLKIYMLDSEYYTDMGLEKFSELSRNLRVTNNLIGESDLNNLYEFLDCYYYSNYISTHLKLASFSILDSSNLFTFDSIAKILQNSLANQCYGFLLVQFLNFNTFFFEFLDIFPTGSDVEFDVNFLIVGFIIIVLALFFKLALAPFHVWSPDVYEGSPSSSTFFFMVLSKFGIFVLLFRLCYFSFYNFISYWQMYSLFISSVSILIGAAAGLKQRKLKSLLTYSSINNMGFVLLAFSSGNFEGIQASFYYLIVYILASLCIWSIVLNLNLKTTLNTNKQNRDLGDLALLQESNSITAQGIGLTLFSLAGLPPTVGFLAKMSVFKILSGFSIYYISIINILFSIIATFYYLRIVKIIFFENFLIGNLYATVSSKSVFITNLLIFLLVYFFLNPVFLYLYSYKIILFLKGSFF